MVLKVKTRGHFNLELISTTFDKFKLYPWCVYNHRRIKNKNMTQKNPQQLKVPLWIRNKASEWKKQT